MPLNTSQNTARSIELRRLGKVGLVCLMCIGTAIGAMLMMRAGYNADPGGLLHLVLTLSFVLTPACLFWLLFQTLSTLTGSANSSGVSQPE